MDLSFPVRFIESKVLTTLAVSLALTACKAEGPRDRQAQTPPDAAAPAASVPSDESEPNAQPDDHADTEAEGPLVTLEFAPVDDSVREALAARTGNAVLADADALLAVRYRVPEHWHIYWINPGDSGLRTQIQSKLPADREGEVGATLYPAPDELLAEGGQLSYGWDGDAVLFVPLRGGAARGPVELESRWLVCRESCIREKATHTVDVSALEPTPEPAPLITAMLARVPEPAGERITGAWSPSGDALELSSSAGAGTATLEAFFPYPSDAALFTGAKAGTEGDLSLSYRFQGEAEARPPAQGVARLRSGDTTRWLEVALPWPAT